MKKKILTVLFVAVVFALTVYSVFDGENLSQVIAYLSTADLLYIIPAVVCVLYFILSESVIIHYIMRTLGNPIRFSHCCRYSFIGFFYCCITPSASGGQPMQVVQMRRDGIPVAVSTVVLAVITILYKMVLVLLGAVVLLIRPASVMLYLEPVEPLILLGMGLNVVCIAALLLLVFKPQLVRLFTERFLALLHRFRPSANTTKQQERVERILGQYEGASEFFQSNNHVVVHAFLITVLQRLSLFLITWLTYRAFSLFGHSMPLITTLQGMISVAADMMPLPGGMGVSENLFLEIFQPIFGEELVLPGMMVSRGVSYYSQLVISAAVTAYAALKYRLFRKKGGKVL